MPTKNADQLPHNPRERANFCSALMFCFALPILFKGRKKTLDQDDLYRPLVEHKSDILGDKLYHAWEREVAAKSNSKKQPSLLKAIIRVFAWPLTFSGLLLGALEFGTKVTQPFCLAGLIAYFSGDDPNLSKAHLYMAAIVVTTMVNVLLMHPYSFSVYHLGMKVRVALCSILYRKALRLSRTAMGDTTIGQVVNLMSNDVGRFDSVLMHLHFLWIAPLQLIVITYLMYEKIGVSSLIGVGIMLLFLPFQSYLGSMVSMMRLRTALCTDYRVRLMNEIISGIQVIKMYAWEKPFGKLVEDSRIKEMNIIKKANYIRGVLLSFTMYLSRISIFASLVGFVLLGNFLDAETAFLITAYYNILRRTVTMFFPFGISQCAEIMVSMLRIETFMLREESTVHNEMPFDYDAKHEEFDHLNDNGGILVKKPRSTSKRHDEKAVIINNLNAKWDPESPELTLNDISFILKPHQLVAVIGPVGSGKSSLIETILGELLPQSGTVEIHGEFSYASQEPWLFTGTVRQNIIFGLPMDKLRYRAVVKKCALERDFELLPQGDKTIVGERGASLSGGQKARISLARAVYRKADIYLLDDPLSAVDTHVGRHLFDQCMRGYLRDKAVLLVTHQLQFLQEADQIVIMDKGRIKAVGTYDSMLKTGLDFARLLTNHREPDEKAAGDATTKHRTHSSFISQQSRNSSFASMSSFAESIVQDSPMQIEETREEGKIDFDLYIKYFGAGAGFFMFMFLLFLSVGSQVLGSGADYFLVYWVKKDKTNDDSNASALDIYYFTALNISVVIFTLVRTFLFCDLAMRASSNLHNNMYRGITRAAMYFFNVNPSGRILNRFSKDLGQIDEVLPVVMTDLLQIFITLAGIVVVVCITNPWYLLVTLVLGIIFHHMRDFYLNTSRDVKRLEAVSRSPIYSHLGASLNGLATIRAFGAEEVLTAEFDNYQDLHSSAYYTFLSTNRAFGYYLDFFCGMYIVVITLSYLFYTPSNAGEVGLAISQAMGITGMVQWGMRQSAELENLMTSVERVVEYDNIEPEGEYESQPAKKPPESWPEEGQIIAKDLSLRYFPDPESDCVLKSLNFEIKACEKVGIVGRTGAGKSSLINALFRLSFNDGSMLIDRRETSEIGLHDLRSKISIIPQEPVLFSGTMRYNLDPFEQYSDEKLWGALDEVKLKSAISELPSGLQSKISEGGTNFSVGQRQLVCLARAILRENRILVMDEATANVDPQTDALIQTTIRNKFKNCTVLTIAHRLHTIMDSDKVLVMDAGRVVEFGSPYELLTNSDSKIFHSMLMQTGKTTFDNLLTIAEKAHKSA